MAAAEKMYAGDTACRALAIVIENVEPGSAVARMKVNTTMVNGHNICHGGYIFTLADTAFAYACNSYGRKAVAASASIDFLRSATLDDVLIAAALECHRGGRSGLYDVRVENGSGELIAMFRGRSVLLRDKRVTE